MATVSALVFVLLPIYSKSTFSDNRGQKCWHDQKFIPFVPPPLLNVELPNSLRWQSLSMKDSTLEWGRGADKNA